METKKKKKSLVQKIEKRYEIFLQTLIRNRIFNALTHEIPFVRNVIFYAEKIVLNFSLLHFQIQDTKYVNH